MNVNTYFHYIWIFSQSGEAIKKTAWGQSRQELTWSLQAGLPPQPFGEAGVTLADTVVLHRDIHCPAAALQQHQFEDGGQGLQCMMVMLIMAAGGYGFVNGILA